jgi:hypothetical protein
MINLQNVFLILAMALLLSCQIDDFIAEPEDPRMPAYTESGENVAGALIDGQIWTAFSGPEDDYVPVAQNAKMYFYFSPDADSLFLAIQSGRFRHNYAEASVGFYIPSVSVRNTEDLIALQGHTISLDGEENYGQLFFGDYRLNNGPTGVSRGVGTLYIRKVGLNTEDDDEDVNISGTFGFDIKIDGVKHTVYSGRFDYAISELDVNPLYP